MMPRWEKHKMTLRRKRIGGKVVLVCRYSHSRRRSFAHSGDSTEVELICTYLLDNADRKPTSPGDSNAAPLDHPWVPYGLVYSYDGEREGIAQAP